MRRDVLNYLPADVVRSITGHSNPVADSVKVGQTGKTSVMVMDKPPEPSTGYRKALEDAGVPNGDIEAQIDKWAAMIPADIILDPSIPLAEQAQIFPESEVQKIPEQTPVGKIKISRKIERTLRKASDINYDPSDDLTEATIATSLEGRKKITAKTAKQLVRTYEAKQTEVYVANRKQPKRK